MHTKTLLIAASLAGSFLLATACGGGGAGGGGSTGGATTTISSSAPTGGSSMGGGGTGGAPCGTPEDCPPAENECQSPTCTAGLCGVSFLPAGQATAAQTAGDCHKNACDGAGDVNVVVDDTDAPDDSNPCTTDTCSAGAKVFAPVALGTACGLSLVCDGAGHCVGCNQPSDCPGDDTVCKTKVCSGGTCAFDFVAAGTAAGTPTPGDCHRSQCDGAGNLVVVIDDTDVPVDGKACTSDVCSAGVPLNPKLPSGTPCSQGLGTVCDTTGSCVQCLGAGDCLGQDTACRVRTCVAGACGHLDTPAGTPVGTQVAGDCHRVQCDGAGNQVNVVDDTDKPVDGHPCTNDICAGGVASNPPAASGTPCSQNGGTVCNSAGACVACVATSDCPGQDTPCKARSCSASNTCMVIFTPAGQPAGPQTAGDCRVAQCDGNGNPLSVVNDADVPVDGRQCTQDTCTSGVPSNPPVSAGTSCNETGGNHCDGMGNCVGCVSSADCPPTGSECVTAVCVGGMCGTANVMGGTVTQAQMSGDCLRNQCDGNGHQVAVPFDTDLPLEDGNVCTVEACKAGVASYTPLAAGTPCSQNGGVECNGVASAPACTQPVVVVRIGDGTPYASGDGAPVFLESYYLVPGASPHAVWSLPVAVTGANQPFTLTTSATSEGLITRSADQHTLTLAGYAAVPGTAGLPTSSSSTIPRVVARVGATGTMNTTTLLDVGLSNGNPRGAASADGLGIWASGSAGGVWYVPFGTTGGTQILGQSSNPPSNVRALGIFDGQLYATAASGTFASVLSIGSGLPLTQAVGTLLPGLPSTSGPGPYGFLLFDLDATVAGLDTLYLADERNPPSGGIQKWAFDGAVWSLATTFNNGATRGCRGLAGWTMPGGKVTLACTDTISRLLAVVDDPAAPSPLFTLIATAALNDALRGVAVAPR